MKDEIWDVRIKSMSGCKDMRFRMTGTEHDHFVVCLDDEWNCDCMGFIVRKDCRHVKCGKVLQEKLRSPQLVVVGREEK